MVEKSKYHYDCLLDLRGKLCPLPIVLTKKELMTTPSGVTLKVVASDCGSIKDFLSWSHAANDLFELIGQETVTSDHETVYIHYLKKQ